MTAENRRAFHVRSGMRRGLRTEVPIPTRLVSNEEFPPLPQTAEQRAVEDRILAEAARLAPRLGLSRRDFLRTSGGMATSLLAMNAVFGRFFDVLPVEAVDPGAFQQQTGDPFFIFDLQLHYVGAGYDPRDEEASRKGAVSKGGLLGLRRQARRLNPKLASDRGTLADLSWANFVKEVFLDSETAIGLISTPPGPYPQEAEKAVCTKECAEGERAECEWNPDDGVVIQVEPDARPDENCGNQQTDPAQSAHQVLHAFCLRAT